MSDPCVPADSAWQPDDPAIEDTGDATSLRFVLTRGRDGGWHVSSPDVPALSFGRSTQRKAILSLADVLEDLQEANL